MDFRKAMPLASNLFNSNKGALELDQELLCHRDSDLGSRRHCGELEMNT